MIVVSYGSLINKPNFNAIQLNGNNIITITEMNKNITGIEKQCMADRYSATT